MYHARNGRYLLNVPRTEATRSPLTIALAEQIRAERGVARLSQLEVCRRTGLARSTYVRVETAERDIDLTQLAVIAPVFGLTVSELVRRAEQRLTDSDE